MAGNLNLTDGNFINPLVGTLNSQSDSLIKFFTESRYVEEGNEWYIIAMLNGGCNNSIMISLFIHPTYSTVLLNNYNLTLETLEDFLKTQDILVHSSSVLPDYYQDFDIVFMEDSTGITAGIIYSIDEWNLDKLMIFDRDGFHITTLEDYYQDFSEIRMYRPLAEILN